MRIRVFVAGLLLASASIPVFFVAAAQAALGFEAKLALHVKAHTSKSSTICGSADAGGWAPTDIPCSRYVTTGDLGTAYDVYLVVARMSPAAGGVRGFSFGIDYNGAPGQGVDVFEWRMCADGLPFTQPGPWGDWPSAGSGNRITWVQCSGSEIPPSGLHAIAASFYVYAYSPDQFRITENRYLESGPELLIAPCYGGDIPLPVGELGKVSFSAGGVTPGYNPCPNDLPAGCPIVELVNAGEVPMGGFKDFTVTLTNPENQPISGVASELNPYFQILSGASYSIPAHGTWKLLLRFSPPGPVSTTCALRAGANCPTVNIVAAGSLLDVLPLAVSETLLPGARKTRGLDVRNLGSDGFNWSAGFRYGALEDDLVRLDAAAGSLTATIPDLFLFDGGDAGQSIRDWRIYDPLLDGLGGNFLRTNRDGPVDYTDGIILMDQSFGAGNRYFTRKYPGLFVLAAELSGVKEFHTSGFLLTNPGRGVELGEVRVEQAGVEYYALARQVYGGGLPSLIQIVVVPGGENVTQDYEARPEFGIQRVSGLQHYSRLYYLNAMTAGGSLLASSQIEAVVRALVRAISPNAPWLSATPVVGYSAAHGHAPLDVNLDATGLGAGIHRAFVDVVAEDNYQDRVQSVPVVLTVLDAPDLSLAPINVDFDSVFVGSARPESVTVSNLGSAALTVTAAVDPAPFTVSNGGFSVPPGGTRQVVVSFSPGEAGPVSGTLTLATNDPDETTVLVPLSGVGVLPPELVLDVQPLVAAAMPGGEKRKSLAFANAGPGDLEFDFVDRPAWLTPVPSSGRLGAGESKVVDLVFSALDLEPAELAADLVLRCNDPGNPVATIPMTFHVGTVAPARAEIGPESLNPGSKGRWVTARIELPADLDPADVVEGTVRALDGVGIDEGGAILGDFNQNGVPDWTFKFSREAFVLALPPTDDIAVPVCGEVRDQTWFRADLPIRVVRPHLTFPNGGERWVSGAWTTIRWDVPSGWESATFSLAYSSDGGATWSTIAEQVGGGSLVWRVPEGVTETGLVSIRAYDEDGMIGHDVSDLPFSVTVSATGIEEARNPDALTLNQNVPNPFRGSTTIRFSLPADGEARLEIFEVTGRSVRTLHDGIASAGTRQVRWDGRDRAGVPVSSGLYFYRLRTEEGTVTRRMFLLP